MIARAGSLVITNYEVLDGYAVANNVPPLETLPLRRLISYVYWFFTQNMSKEDVNKFRAKLWQPPKGVAAHERSPWAPKAEQSAFGSLKAQLGLSGKAN